MKLWNILLGLAACVLIPRSTLAETYTIDTAHAHIGFSIRHLGINNIRGQFKDFTGSIEYSGQMEDLRATCTIRAKSIDTGVKLRDEHLRSPDFFDVAKYPEIKFRTKSVDKREGVEMLIGTLTMHGVSKEIAMKINVAGPVDSPFEAAFKIIGLHAKTTLNRRDFGVKAAGATDKLIGDTVKIEINLEAKT
jgi:polyisoprenoid-binding protein YceI